MQHILLLKESHLSGDNYITPVPPVVENKIRQMNKIISGISATFIAAVMFASCDSPEKKVENAEANVTTAKDDLEKAQIEYAAEVDTFRRESDARIMANEKTISEFNA